MSSYILTGPATCDIDDILDYIAAQSAQNALLVAARFEAAFDRIATSPSIGHKRSELKDRNARVYSVSGYLIIYDPVLAPVHILRIVRGSRDIGKLPIR